MDTTVETTLPLTITFRNMKKSQWLEDVITKRSTRLARYYDRIISCRVVVEIPHKHQHQGNYFHIRLDIKVPGKEIVVTREPVEHASAEDINAVVKDVFDAAKRQLDDYARVQRRDVKTHVEPPHASIAQIFPDREFGFLETPDGREIYFHAHSVVNGDFEQLKPGTPVTFVEEMGVEGPQASTVKLIRK